MCGRFALVATREEITRQFRLTEDCDVVPRYNIAPGQQIIIIRQRSEGSVASLVRWGLIPHWTKEESFSARVINARAETVHDKPLFREAFRLRRCLVPGTGFYEWKAVGNKKQPYFIHLDSNGLFAMAGIWESWRNPGGETIESCAIITTAANPVVRRVHDRMPVILPRESYLAWLDDASSVSLLQDTLRPFFAEAMSAYPVSGKVNTVSCEGEVCLRRVL